MKAYLSLIKFSHTIFALPFAILGYVLGTEALGHAPSLKLLILVVLCMIFARSAAMSFNRYADRQIDAKNERTAIREIPSGIINAKSALTFVIINSLLFIICTFLINPLCFALSPIALAVILGYSYSKRYTFLCHFILGLGLALAPVGAYIAVTGYFSGLPILYGVIVMLWVSGFDIIYALQDEDFDKSHNLHSVPTRFGRWNSLKISAAVHILCGLLLIIATYWLIQSYSQVGYLHGIGSLIFIALLVYQHSIVSPKDLSRINRAFFTSNGIASLVFAGLVILDFYF